MLIEGYGKAIIKRLQRVLPYNVNIINPEGFIIASTNPERIGTPHQGGFICAEKRETVLITKENLAEYPGCKEGINLPVIHKDELIGVVGITGDPDQVENLGLAIKEIVELILAEYDYQTKAVFRQESAIQSLFEDIIFSQNDSSVQYYEQKAKSLNVPLFDNILALGEYRPLKGKLDDKICHMASEDLELAVKQIFRGRVICSLEGENRKFVLILPASPPCLSELDALSKYFETNFSLVVPIVVSESCKELTDYRRQYLRCEKVLKMNPTMPNSAVIFESEYTFDLLMDSIPADEARRYIEKYCGILSGGYNHIDDAVIQTLKDFFENDMSITQTAASSHLHKNTIAYRLRKVREAYPELIDSTYEYMKLYMAIRLYEGQKL